MKCRLNMDFMMAFVFCVTVANTSLNAAELVIDRLNLNTARLSWPIGPYEGYLLERTTSLSPSARVWSTQEGAAEQVGDRWQLDVALAGDERFFRLRYPARLISELSPSPGDEMVSVMRHPVVRFDGIVQAQTLTSDTLRFTIRGKRVPGLLRVSSTNRFATFVPDEALPPSSEITVTVDGNAIIDDKDMPIDGDGDLLPGGIGEYRFRTLPLDRIPKTNVFGFVRDSFTGEVLEGVTIRLDAFPEANAVTDASGRFELNDMPAPEFFVHIDGSTVSAPEGMRYPVVGKAFHSSPAETIQLAMNGEPFDIYLPLMADADVQALSSTDTTEVGIGETGKARLESLFPNMDASIWDEIGLSVEPGSAIDDRGNPSTSAAIVPVPPDRIPAPLPSNLKLSLVISIQVEGATSFDKPASITFPNTDELAPGDKTFITSFDHAAGEWVIVGTATVSEDGRTIVSDPGVGILAPGWHGVTSTSEVDINISKKPTLRSALGGLAANTVATGLNYASVVVGGVDILIPENPVLPLGNALSLLSASLGTTADVISNGGSLSKSGALALATSGAGALTPEPISGTILDVVGTGMAINSTADSAIAGAKDLSDLIAILSGSANSDWARSLDEIAAYAREMDHHYSLVAQGLLGLRAVLEAAPEGTSDPQILAQFLEASDAFIEGEKFFATRGGGNIGTALQRLADDFTEWMLHFEELHGHQFETAANAPFRVTDSQGTEVFRGVTNGAGRARFLLGAGDVYDITVVDPVFNELVVIRVGLRNGGERRVIKQYMTPVTGLDTDGDGLLDEIETVIGTGVNTADSDGDGLDDGTEVRQGFDPLNGRLIATGVVSSLQLPGPVIDVELASEMLALAITEENALSRNESEFFTFDVSDPRAPIVLGSFGLEGRPTDLDYDPSLQFAAVANGESVTVFDYSDPTRLSQVFELEVGATSIEMEHGILYATGPGLLVSYSSETGLPIVEMALDDGKGQRVSASKGNLYLVNGASLRIYDSVPTIDPSTGALAYPLLGETTLTGDVPPLETSKALFVGTGYAYVGSSIGYEVIDISDSSLPRVVGTPPQIQEIVHDIVANGSGRIVTVTSFAGPSTLHLSIYDGSDPTDVTRVQAQIDTPGETRAIALGNGLAFVADGLLSPDFINGQQRIGQGSFAIVNYLSPDIQGVPPQVELVSPEDRDLDRAGIQVIEGSSIRLEAEVMDDVQVRKVELLVDGQVVAADVSFPWELPVLVELGTAGSTMTVQVLAEDTGGNIGQSEMLLLEVLPDVDGPILQSNTPLDGATRGGGFRTVQFYFSEPIAEFDFNSTISLTNAAGDQTFAPAQINLTRLNRVLLVDYPDLADGEYRLQLDQSRIRDRVGNQLGDGLLTIAFSKTTSSAVWIAAGGGSWHDPANWEGAKVPKIGERVVISVPNNGGTVTFSEGTARVEDIVATQPIAIEGGVLQANSMETSSLSLSGGELLVDEQVIIDGAFHISEGLLRAGRLDYGEVSTATGGRIQRALIASANEAAVLNVEDSLLLEDASIGEDTIVNILNSATMEILSTFKNGGIINIGEDDAFSTLSISEVEECECGDIYLLGHLAAFEWSSETEKRLIGDTRITLVGREAFIGTSGDGPLVIGADTTITFAAAEKPEVGQSISTENGIVLDGQIVVDGPTQNAVIFGGEENVFEVRQGSVLVDNGARLSVMSPVVREGATLSARNGSILELLGQWQGAGMIVDGSEVRLGGDFVSDDVNALNRSNAVTTIIGRFDLQGEALSNSETWGVEFGTLANGRLDKLDAFTVERLLGLEGMTIGSPLTISENLRIINDLTLEADLTLTARSLIGPFVFFDGPGDQTIKGSGIVRLKSFAVGVVQIPLLFSIRSEGALVIADGIVIEGGSAIIGDEDRPLILRGTVRAATQGGVINLLGNPFTNDGGQIEESNGGTVTINGG